MFLKMNKRKLKSLLIIMDALNYMNKHTEEFETSHMLCLAIIQEEKTYEMLEDKRLSPNDRDWLERVNKNSKKLVKFYTGTYFS